MRCRDWFTVDFPRTVTLIFIYSMLCGNWLIFRIDFMFNKRQYHYHGKRFAWCLFYILIFERRTSSVTLYVAYKKGTYPNFDNCWQSPWTSCWVITLPDRNVRWPRCVIPHEPNTVWGAMWTCKQKNVAWWILQSCKSIYVTSKCQKVSHCRRSRIFALFWVLTSSVFLLIIVTIFDNYESVCYAFDYVLLSLALIVR